MTTIVLVRHGQTEWNPREREHFRGRVDLPLNETGIRQARALAERVAGLHIQAIYSSPFQRAFKTAQIVARRLKLRPEILLGIIDIDYGDWQGCSHKEIAKLCPELYGAWLATPHLVRFPEGESLDEVRARAFPALQEIALQHEEQMILLVAHQAVNKALFCAILGLEDSHFWRIRQDTCCINVFEYQDGTYTISLINDTCHLRSLIPPG